MADNAYSSPALIASDTVDLQAGFFSRFGDAATKGLGSAAVSGALGIYNTALDYFGGEAVDTSRVLRNFDSDWGNYYDQNKEIIDLAGFVGASIVPGSLGIKALKLARSGTALGPVSRALNLAPTRAELALNGSAEVPGALQYLAKSGGTATAEIGAAKRANLAWNVADNILTSAAAELAIVATMNDSPIFEHDTAADFAKNVAFGALFGGAIGGAFSHMETRGILKAAASTIQAGKRKFDTIFDPVKLGLTKSDEILNFVENMVKVPDDFYSTTFKYKFGGKDKTVVLDTADAFKKARQSAEDTAFDTLRLKFNELAEGGEHTGQAFFEMLAGRIKSGREADRNAEDISDEVRGYLQGVRKIGPLQADAGQVEAPRQFFVTQQPTGMADLFSETRHAGTGKQAYYLTTNDPRQLKIGSVARLGLDSAEEAFQMGYDAVVTKSGKMAINPKSKTISKTPDQALNTRFYLDLETGGLTSTPIVTGADLMKTAADFRSLPDSVWIAGKKFVQAESKAADLETSALDASARFMWAGSETLSDASFKKRVIEWNDFPLLDRAKSIEALSTSGETAIKMPDGSLQYFTDIVDIPGFVNELKLEFLQGALNKAEKGYDTRHIQAHLNVSRQWYETAVANNFAKTGEQLKESRKLSEFFRPTTVSMEWEKNAAQQTFDPTFVGPNHWTTVSLTHHYNLQMRVREQDNAALSVFGEDYKLFQDADAALAGTVTEQGAGATGFGFSNADYGDKARLHVQDTGKATSLVQQKWRDQTISSLAPSINRIRDKPEAAAELGILTTALRRDPEKYYLVLEDEVGNSAPRLVDRAAHALLEKNPNDFSSLDDAIEYLQASGKRGEYKIKNAEVAEFWNVSRALNRERLWKQTTLLNATGIARNLDPEVIYAPPVDTRRYPFFAFVSAKEKVGAITDLSMITAKSEEQLRALASQVGEEYEVIFKNDTKKFFKAKGQYDYSMQINASRVNSDLQRRGILGDFFPETRAENVLEDYVRWHGNSSDSLVRMGVEVKNRQFLSELNFLSEQYQNAATSTVGSGTVLKSKIADPFGDYRKTMLNISKQGEYPILDSLNEFSDRIGRKMYEELDKLRDGIFGKKGTDFVSMERANQLMQDAGLEGTYKTMEAYVAANERYPKNLLREAFQKVNYWLATTTLRLDFANSIVNIISTPIMLGTEMSSIKRLVAGDSELAGKLAELTHLKVPGQNEAFPSTTRLIANSISNYFGKDKAALIQRYTDSGDIKGISQLYHEVLDDLAYMPNRTGEVWKAKLEKAVEKGSKITGNNFAEEFTRFVSADVMRQLSDPIVAAGKMSVKEQNAYISSFVNRVQGNYIYSQRPLAFQGTLGSAVSLFQTYSFNVLQQLFRHVEAGDKRTLAVFAGLQSSIYGMNGLPFFDAVNTHLIGKAAGNPEHKDAYSTVANAQSELGDWLMFGSASAFPLFGSKSPALFSRGDINPRNVTLLPVNPLDVPAVSASLKLVQSVAGFARQVGNGADLSQSFFQALEHQGWSRPLAGFGQLLAGQSTTSKGSLVSAANDLETTSWLSKIHDRMVTFGGVSRLMGAKPMDEAVALHNLYRIKAYQAVDRQKIEALGQAVKTKLAGNQMPSEEEMDDFMQSYVNSGGRQETFSASMQHWMKDANSSIVNQMAAKTGSSYGRTMQNLLGGEPLQDYNTLASSPATPLE